MMATTEITNDAVGAKLAHKIAAISQTALWQRVEGLATNTPDDTMTHEELREFVKLLFGPEADLAD